MINSIWQSSGERVKTIDNNFFTVFHIWNFYQLLFTNKTCSLGFWETLSAFHMISLRGCESGHKICQKKILNRFSCTVRLVLSFWVSWPLHWTSPHFYDHVCRSAGLRFWSIIFCHPFLWSELGTFFFKWKRVCIKNCIKLKVYKPVFFFFKLRISLSAKSK